MKTSYQTPDVERIDFEAKENIADVVVPGGDGGDRPSERPMD